MWLTALERWKRCVNPNNMYNVFWMYEYCKTILGGGFCSFIWYKVRDQNFNDFYAYMLKSYRLSIIIQHTSRFYILLINEHAHICFFYIFRVVRYQRFKSFLYNSVVVLTVVETQTWSLLWYKLYRFSIFLQSGWKELHTLKPIWDTSIFKPATFFSQTAFNKNNQ